MFYSVVKTAKDLCQSIIMYVQMECWFQIGNYKCISILISIDFEQDISSTGSNIFVDCVSNSDLVHVTIHTFIYNVIYLIDHVPMLISFLFC